MHPDETTIEAGKAEQEFQTEEGRAADKLLSDIAALSNKHGFTEEFVVRVMILRNNLSNGHTISWPENLH